MHRWPTWTWWSNSCGECNSWGLRKGANSQGQWLSYFLIRKLLRWMSFSVRAPPPYWLWCSEIWVSLGRSQVRFINHNMVWRPSTWVNIVNTTYAKDFRCVRLVGLPIPGKDISGITVSEKFWRALLGFLLDSLGKPQSLTSTNQLSFDIFRCGVKSRADRGFQWWLQISNLHFYIAAAPSVSNLKTFNELLFLTDRQL